MSRRTFQSMVLLLFVGGLAAFFLVNPARWLPSHRDAEPLALRLKATPDLDAWLEDARVQFLGRTRQVGRRPLALVIDYEGDAEAAGSIAASLTSDQAYDAWLVGRAVTQIPAIVLQLSLSAKAVMPLATTVLGVVMWEARAPDILREAGVALPASPPPTWGGLEVEWTAWHRALAPQGVGNQSGGVRLRWAMPHPVRSAPGLTGLSLMSLGYLGPNQVRWPEETRVEEMLLPWLTDFLRTVHRFRPSARDTANDFLNYGPSQADVALLPEHLALEVLARAPERAGQGAVLLYPRVNVAYEYVFVDLRGPTATGPRREGTDAFHRFLRSEQGQYLALAHGLRSVLQDLKPRPDDPWPRLQARGARFALQVAWVDVPAVIEPARRLAQRAMERLDPR